MLARRAPVCPQGALLNARAWAESTDIRASAPGFGDRRFAAPNRGASRDLPSNPPLHIQRRRVESLDGKTAVVVTSDGEPVSIGRFHVLRDPLLNQIERVELAFETHLLSCRLRVPHVKIPDIKKTWNGESFRYELPAGDAAWRGPREEEAPPGQPAPVVETFPLPPLVSKPIIPTGQQPWAKNAGT